jgi:hypothetical protein
MADEPTKEQRFACGCHIVDGELVAECTQVAPTGEIPAEHHGPVAKPFSAKCSRTAVQTPGPPEPPAPGTAEEKFDDSPAEDEETRAEEAADEVDDAVAEAAVTEAKPTKNAVHTMDAPKQAHEEAKPHKKKKKA